jgi:hypothetical protein
MITLAGIVLIVLSLPLFKMGIGSLKDRSNHLEYGVESQKTHSAFSWLFIILASAFASGGGWLLAG